MEHNIELRTTRARSSFTSWYERLRYTNWTNQIPKEQARFVGNKGTHKQILNVHQLVEMCKEYKYFCKYYVSWINKALIVSGEDSCGRLWTKWMYHHIRLHFTRNLYADSRAMVRLQKHRSSIFSNLERHQTELHSIFYIQHPRVSDLYFWCWNMDN